MWLLLSTFLFYRQDVSKQKIILTTHQETNKKNDTVFYVTQDSFVSINGFQNLLYYSSNQVRWCCGLLFGQASKFVFVMALLQLQQRAWIMELCGSAVRGVINWN